jgi:ABC-type multidrug transport system fused ATPase/permease subunit
MPFTQKLLLNVPAIPLGILFIIVAVALSLAGLILTRRFVSKTLLKSHHELTNAIFQAIGMAYAVLLAFVVVVSWQNFDETKKEVETEANCLVDLYQHSAAFPDVFRDQARAALKNYGRTVVEEEWAMLARGEESEKARQAMGKVWEVYTAFEPRTEKEKAFFSESVGKLDDLRESRRLRIVASRVGVHPALWFALLVGAVATVGFTFFFGADNFTAHAVMASILAVIIALIMFTILLFDFPFTGSVSLGPETFLRIIGL